ncbi:MAG TPA: hypothetical protein VFW96_15165 [Thermomicrobiales bacterium]|nr:hypothetical protein [Thermomicrobiales bacterium]
MAETPGRYLPGLPLIAAFSDPKLEGRLIPSLLATGRFRLERCASANELLDALREPRHRDALVLTQDDLPHLRVEALAEIGRRGLPLVLLARRPADPCWSGLSGAILPVDATPQDVAAALERVAATTGQPAVGRSGTAVDRDVSGDGYRPELGPDPSGTRDGGEPRWPATVYTVASGPGAPGRTTVALGLATALGAVAPTLLVDADLAGPSLAAYLDADPSRNLYLLAGAAPRTARDWARACADELQPLGPAAPHGALLCGVPKGERGGKVNPAFLERALDVFGRRYRHLVLDVGADLAGNDAAPLLHRAAVARAHHLLLVGTADVPGLKRLRETREFCVENLGVDRRRVALVLNRYDRRRHHPLADIEAVFAQPLAAVLPYDYGATQRALAAQHALVLERRSRAAEALLTLAARAHGDRIAPGDPAGRTARPAAGRWFFRRSVPTSPRPAGQSVAKPS